MDADDINVADSDDDDAGDGGDATTAAAAERSKLRRGKITVHTIFGLDDGNSCTGGNRGKKASPIGGEGITGWITKSNLKQSGRRQSLDILLDAGDRVKDVFATGFSRVGKSLERRNSESEVSEGVVANATDGMDGNGGGGGRSSALSGRIGSAEPSSGGSDFFSFGSRSAANDLLTDEQIENLLLSEDCAEMLRNVLNISKS